MIRKTSGFKQCMRNIAPRTDIDSASLHADKSEKLTKHRLATFYGNFYCLSLSVECFSLSGAPSLSPVMRVCVFYNKSVTWVEPREVGKFVDGINVWLKGSSCRRGKSFRLASACLIVPADVFAQNRHDVGQTWQRRALS